MHGFTTSIIKICYKVVLGKNKNKKKLSYKQINKEICATCYFIVCLTVGEMGETGEERKG